MTDNSKKPDGNYQNMIISPYQENAFSEPVLHALVLSKIDFDLPDEIWESINDGFSNYWNKEVGFGNNPYDNEAANSIETWLKNEGFIYNYERIKLIVNIIFDFIEKIPGVLLDDDEFFILPNMTIDD